MATGRVKFFLADKGYGFIEPDDGGKDVFVHVSALQRAGIPTVQKDDEVAYELEKGRNGRIQVGTVALI